MRALVRIPLHALALVATLGLSLTACDTYEDDDDDGGRAYGVTVVDFTINGDDFTLSEDGQVASYETGDISSEEARDDVRRALAEAGNGALVMLYADNSLILENTDGSYTPLPVTVGQEILVTGGADGQSDDVTTLAITYTYAFDNQDLYLDVLSTTPLEATGDGFLAFEDFLPSVIDLRLVTVPADLYYGKAGARIDLRDYEAVKQAFNLPD